MPKVKFRKFLPSILVYPFFMLINSLAITIGALNPNQKWKAVKRTKIINYEDIEKEQKKINDETIKKSKTKKIDN